LGVQEANGHLEASMLWGWGSVEPVASAKVEDGHLALTRKHEVQQKDASGKKTKQTIIETITGTVQGDGIKLTSMKPRENGQGEESAEFGGRRQPPMPPAPNLKKVKFGKPIRLFDGKDLAGWPTRTPSAAGASMAGYWSMTWSSKKASRTRIMATCAPTVNLRILI
jgi:hypothetical protein